MRQLALGLIVSWGIHLGVLGFIYQNGGPYGRPQPGIWGKAVPGNVMPSPWIRVSW